MMKTSYAANAAADTAAAGAAVDCAQAEAVSHEIGHNMVSPATEQALLQTYQALAHDHNLIFTQAALTHDTFRMFGATLCDNRGFSYPAWALQLPEGAITINKTQDTKSLPCCCVCGSVPGACSCRASLTMALLQLDTIRAQTAGKENCDSL
jgi:hypothetical protein